MSPLPDATLPAAVPQGGPSPVLGATWERLKTSAVPRRHAPVQPVPPHTSPRGAWFDADAARTMFEANPCGVVLITDTGLIVDANAAFLVITGRSWLDLAGRTIESVIRRSDGTPLGLPDPAGFVSTDALQVEREVLTAGGELLALEMTVIPIGGPSELPLRAVQIVDVTNQRRAEHDLLMAENGMTAG